MDAKQNNRKEVIMDAKQEITKQAVKDGWMRTLAHSCVRNIRKQLDWIEAECSSTKTEEELFYDVMKILHSVAQSVIGGMENAADDHRFNVVHKPAMEKEQEKKPQP
jgi:predicted site-specific integrase-resolvase